MKKIIIKKEEKNFSYIFYFIFTYLKKYKIYDRFIKEDIFYLPFKKRLNSAYLRALKEYLKSKKITHFLSFDKEIERAFKNTFSAINGNKIYNTIFIDILEFLSENNLNSYEIVFVSDNVKEIKNLIEKCIKKVKAVSVLTEKPFLYESIKDYALLKYGVNINIRTKKEKLKKHNKIYVNCGSNRVFDYTFFNNVNMLDIYSVYKEGLKTIILEAQSKEKEYTKALNWPYSLALAEFLHPNENNKKLKIVSIKK